MILSTLLVIAFATMAVLIYRRRHAITVADRAEELDAHSPTEKEIEQAFRETEAPMRRQYRGGEFGVDQSGRKFVADQNGALRRVEVVETEDGETIMAARKLSKAERKLRKRQKQEMRSSIEASIDRPLAKIRRGLLASGADPELVEKINVRVSDWHELGKRIVAAGMSSRRQAIYQPQPEKAFGGFHYENA